MLVDVMSSYNYIQVNTKLINLLGLNVATYWAELLNIYPRVIRKKKDEVIQSSGYFTVDRDYIKSRTALDLQEQFTCDKVLINIGVLAVDENDSNRICISLTTMHEIMTADDDKALAAIQKKAKVKKATSSEAKKAAIRTNLKNSVVEVDIDLLKAYHTWIEAILDSGNWLNKAVIEVFQKTVKTYSNSKAIQLKIIEIATIHGYKDASWAINVYSKDSRKPGTFIGIEQKQNVGIDPNSVF
jgi:hypothetical protein